MFAKENRYMTSGVADTLDIRLIAFLWNRIDDLVESGQELDYLQAFQLEADRSRVLNQRIIHRSEQPELYLEYRLRIIEPITCKVWVIDSRDYSTMLFPYEY